jgi:hypothetical protein
MRKKNSDVYGMRLSMKNRIYLERLGIIDGRTGTVKSNVSVNFTEFVNHCITMVCESRMSVPGKAASSDELRTAWIKFQVRILNGRIKSCQDELIVLSGQVPKVQELKEAEDVLSNL